MTARVSPDRRAMLAKVHMAAQDLAMPKDNYRDLLERLTGRRSAKECSDAQLHHVLAEFAHIGWTPKPKRRRGRHPRGPGAMAPLAAKVRALWRALDNLGELTDGSEAALAAFVRRQAKVDAVEFLTPTTADSAIEALKAWCARAGFQVPAKGIDAKRELLRVQWRRLGELGALRVYNEAALDNWLHFKVSDHAACVAQLDAAQCDAAADRLGKWLRKAKKEVDAALDAAVDGVGPWAPKP